MRRVLNVALALLGVAFLVLYFPRSPASTAPICQSLAAVLKAVEANPQVVSLRILSGDKLVRAVAFYNNTPPEASEAWTVAILIIGRTSGDGLLMVGHNDDLCGVLSMDSGGIYSLLIIGKASGDGLLMVGHNDDLCGVLSMDSGGIYSLLVAIDGVGI